MSLLLWPRAMSATTSNSPRAAGAMTPGVGPTSAAARLACVAACGRCRRRLVARVHAPGSQPRSRLEPPVQSSRASAPGRRRRTRRRAARRRPRQQRPQQRRRAVAVAVGQAQPREPHAHLGGLRRTGRPRLVRQHLLPHVRPPTVALERASVPASPATGCRRCGVTSGSGRAGRAARRASAQGRVAGGRGDARAKSARATGPSRHSRRAARDALAHRLHARRRPRTTARAAAARARGCVRSPRVRPGGIAHRLVEPRLRLVRPAQPQRAPPSTISAKVRSGTGRSPATCSAPAAQRCPARPCRGRRSAAAPAGWPTRNRAQRLSSRQVLEPRRHRVVLAAFEPQPHSAGGDHRHQLSAIVLSPGGYRAGVVDLETRRPPRGVQARPARLRGAPPWSAPRPGFAACQVQLARAARGAAPPRDCARPRSWRCPQCAAARRCRRRTRVDRRRSGAGPGPD